MMSDLSNPHDKFFKEAFSRLEVARDFLAQQLPPAVLDHIALDTLELQKDTFVDPELAEHFPTCFIEYRRGRIRPFTSICCLNTKVTPIPILRYNYFAI